MTHHLGDRAAATKDRAAAILTTSAGLSFGNAVVFSHSCPCMPNSYNHVVCKDKLDCFVKMVANQCIDSDLGVVEDQ